MLKQAQELIDFGNSVEKAEGYGMMRVIEEVMSFIELDGDEATDGEVIDMIFNKLNN